LRQPLVSVVLPTYNQAGFVAQAILSAVTQDYPNLQVIVRDDGSTDGTVDVILELARQYPDRIDAVVHDGGNVGVTENCNRILARRRGEYVAFHAGDDLWLPGKVSRQVEWLEADARHVLCGHDVEVFDSTTGRRLYLWSELQRPPSGDDARLFVKDGHPWHPLGNLVRSSVVPARGYDPRITLASDWKFFVDCVAQGGAFGQVSGIYARYRSWPGNLSKHRDKMWADVFATLDLIEQEYPRLADACRQFRATALYRCGGELVGAGRVSAAREHFLRAVRVRPWSRTGALALLAAVAPGALSQFAVRVLRRLRAAGLVRPANA
jgi:glycosyltransferase involved in cell wall biosynthesis